jgi:hypothetical protein
MFHSRMLALLAATAVPFPAHAALSAAAADRLWLNR